MSGVCHCTLYVIVGCMLLLSCYHSNVCMLLLSCVCCCEVYVTLRCILMSGACLF